MPAELLKDPAGISCVFSDGRRFRARRRAEPGELVRDLLAGLASMVHPHGSVDAPGTLGAYTQGFADMARFMRERGARRRGPAVPGAAGRVLDAGRRLQSRRPGGCWPPSIPPPGGALQAGVRALADGRNFEARPSSSPLVPYTRQEWEQAARGLPATTG